MKYERVPTETISQVLSYTSSQWSDSSGHKWARYGPQLRTRPDPASQDLHRYYGVCRQWQSIVKYLMLKEMETWPSKKFCCRINDAAFDGNLMVIKLAYLTTKAKLLSSICCKGGMAQPHPGVLSKLADSKFVDHFGYHSRLHRPLEVEALCTAAAKNYHSMAAFFIDKGVDIQGKYPSQRPNYYTEIHRALSYDEVAEFNPGIEPEVERLPMGTWVTPLYASAQWGGSEATMRLLLEKGASVNSTLSFRGRSALFGVIRSLPRPYEDRSRHTGNILARVRLLLEYNADPMIKALGNESVLHCAADRGYIEVLRLLLDSEPRLYDTYKGLTLLHRTSRGCHSAATRMLLEKYPWDINYRSPTYATRDMVGHDALSWAVIGDYSNLYRSSETKETTIRVLLEYGADVSGGGRPITPLILSMDKNEPEITDILLKAGADVEKSYARGWTALEGSITGFFSGDIDISIVRVLLANGADANSLNTKGRTPLTEVVLQPCNEGSMGKKLRIMELLLQHGADIGKSNMDGRPLLNVIRSHEDRIETRLDILRALLGFSTRAARKRIGRAIRELEIQMNA